MSASPFSRTPITAASALNAAVAHERAGRVAEAIQAYQSACALDPGDAKAPHMLGLLLARIGKADQAVGWMRRSIEISPNVAEFHCNLGAVLGGLGRFEEARAALREAIRLEPTWARAWDNLGVLLGRAGRWDQTVEAFARAVEIEPAEPSYHWRLGDALHSAGKITAALGPLQKAIELAEKDGDRQDARVTHITDAYLSLGSALGDLGRLDESLEAYRSAMLSAPANHPAASAYLHVLNNTETDPVKIFAAHVEWGRKFSASIPSADQSSPPGLLPPSGGKMRIGYISADFRDHPRARFLLPVLEAHDRSAVEVCCYSDVHRPDGQTRRFKKAADLWRETHGRSDEQVAAQIRADRIDALIDMAGHMGANRLGVFARRAAPLQALYPGYPGTRGLAEMDLCLTDIDRDGPGSEAFYTEKLLRLEGASQCYDPGDEVPLPRVSNLDATMRNEDAGSSSVGSAITFGCFNRIVKITPTTLDLWSAAMKAVEGSTLLVLGDGQDIDHEPILGEFDRRGIQTQRVMFLPRVPRREYLEYYHRIDIALDTYPYHGHTTTLDALWMGVPVITLMGPTRPAQEGLAMLKAVGLDDLAAHNAEEFAHIAKALAEDPDRRKRLAETLRAAMQRSRLMDARHVAAAIEQLVKMARCPRLS